MNSLVIYAHPNPNSFNASVRDAITDELLKMGHNVCVRDLYEMNFNPILDRQDFDQISAKQIPHDIQLEMDYFLEADQYVFVYPTWFMNMPAILKGYIDRVFYYAFCQNQQDPHEIIKGKPVLIYQTTGASSGSLQESHFITAMKHIQDIGVFELHGMNVLAHEFLYEVPFSSENERQHMLQHIRRIVHNLDQQHVVGSMEITRTKITSS